MKIPARRYQLALLCSLLVLSGFTGFGHWAHKALEASLSGELFGRAVTPPAKPGGGHTASAPSPKLATATSAAAFTNDFFTTATSEAAFTNEFSVDVTAEPAMEPLQSGGPFNINPSIVAGGGGGGPSNGGVNGLTGSVGQSALGTASGGSFGLVGGFWGGAVASGGCAITISPATLPNGQIAQFYSQQLTQVGGVAPLTWSVSVGSLPNNLTLNAATGLLSGTPVANGVFNFTVKVTDTNNCMATQAYSLTISSCPPITLNPVSLPTGMAFTFYSQQLSQSGGTAPIAWSVSAGALPGGLTLNASTGLLSGTPTASGMFNFTIQATDANACTGTRVYGLTIDPNPGLAFYPLPQPVRLLDTRNGAVACFQPNAPIQGGTERTQPAWGTCSGQTIPNSARAITGNITPVNSGGGFLTLFPGNAMRPLVANSNYNPNEIVNNVFTVGLSNVDGSFKIFAFNTTEVVVDVTGYYAPPAPGGLYFHPLPHPVRLLETRAGQSVGCFLPGAPLQAGATRTQQARGVCDGVTIPNTALAVVGNATVVLPQGPGFITLYPSNAAQPLVASGNYQPNDVVNTPFAVGLSPGGSFNIFSVATTEIVVDLLGYYSTDSIDVNGVGLLFQPLAHPVRLLETRAGQPVGCFLPGAQIAGNTEFTQPARVTCDGLTIPVTALGVVGNATVLNSSGGFLTLWPSGATRPLVASSNFGLGQVVNRHFTVGLGNLDGAFKIYSFNSTDLVIDVAGFFAP